MVSGKLDATLAAHVHALETARTAADFEWPRPVKVLVQYSGDPGPIAKAGLIIQLTTRTILVGTVAVKDLARLAELDNVAAIQSNRKLRPHRQLRPERREVQQIFAGPTATPTVTGKNVLIGIIDSGIDIFHPAFVNDGNPPTTRLTALFDLATTQKITATANLTANRMRMRWNPPVLGLEIADNIDLTLNLPATASDVQTAWTNTSAIEPGDIVVTGGPLPAQPMTITITGRYDTPETDTTLIPDIDCAGSPPAAGGAPDFTVTRVGTAINQDKINTALRTLDRAFPFHDGDAVSHGSRVASIAAGAPGSEGPCWAPVTVGGMAPDAGLVAVRAPLSDEAMILAAQFLLDLHATTGQPVVINISRGRIDTAHDGTDCLEQYLDSHLAGTTGRAVVVSAGNEGAASPLPPVTVLPELPTHRDHGGGHTSGAVDANGQIALGFDVEYRDPGPVLCHIWAPGSGQLSVTVTAPLVSGAGSTAPIQPGAPLQTMMLGGHQITAQSTIDAGPYHKRFIAVRIDPPVSTGQMGMGVWTITLREVVGSATSFDCWLMRSTTVAFLPELQTRIHTVDAPATANNVLAVGAYDARNNQLGDFSSRGPTTEPPPAVQRTKPEVCAPGVNIYGAVTGLPTPVVTRYKPAYGTSFAAPYVAGLVALMFEVNPALSYADITKKIMATCVKPDPTLPSDDLAGWGAGRVDPVAAVKAASATPMAADDEPVLPAAAYPALALPVPEQIAALLRRVEGSAAGQTLARLVAKHADEVRRLVESERRITVAWHRMDGAGLLRLILGDPERDVPVPATLGGRPAAEGISRLLDELVRAGSSELRADIVSYRGLVLALPAARLSDLDGQAEVG